MDFFPKLYVIKCFVDFYFTGKAFFFWENFCNVLSVYYYRYIFSLSSSDLRKTRRCCKGYLNLSCLRSLMFGD